MKTPEELKVLKEEVETLNKKLAELSEEELSQVSGGVLPDIIDLPVCGPAVGPTTSNIDWLGLG